MKVADLMTRTVEFIAPNATAQEAATLMGELDVSALPVGTATELLGILTDRDLLYRLVAEGRDPRSTRVIEVATRLVFSCRPDDAIASAMELMAAHNIRRLPVVDSGTMIGWLTLSDLSRHLLIESEIVQKGLEELTDALEAGTPKAVDARQTAQAAD
jgi:CBS domain-containing protein